VESYARGATYMESRTGKRENRKEEIGKRKEENENISS